MLRAVGRLFVTPEKQRSEIPAKFTKTGDMPATIKNRRSRREETLQALIVRWLGDLVDDESFGGSLRRSEFEAELFLENRK